MYGVAAAAVVGIGGYLVWGGGNGQQDQGGGQNGGGGQHGGQGGGGGQHGGQGGGGRQRRRRRHAAAGGQNGGGGHNGGGGVGPQVGAAPQQPVAMVLNDGTEVELEDVRAARAQIDQENATARRLLAAAHQADQVYQAALAAYNNDRQHDQVPTPNGGHVSRNLVHGRVQPYGNNQHYFPNGPIYQETDVNAGFGAAGNYRQILASVPVQGVQEWIGFNITHGGGRWIRVWNGVYWQNWDTRRRMNARAVDLPNHVANAPADNRTPQQRTALRDGVEVKELVIRGFTAVVRVNREH
jgi:hypothetical protein